MAIYIEEHGVSVAMNRTDEALFIELKMKGKLTHEDYEVFVPILERALKESKGLKINMLVDMTEFKGWKLRAAWDDMVFGLKHARQFDKLAVVGKKRWEEISVDMMKPFVKGKIKFFKDRAKAIKWLFNNGKKEKK